MKRVLLLVLASLALPALAAVASAQPGNYNGGRRGGGGGYYTQAPQLAPGGFWDRGGRLVWGLSIGLGGMSSKDGPIDCPRCDYNPLAVEIDLHIGGMLSPRLALMAELQGNVQPVDEQGGGEGTKSLAQGALMFAAQYWVVPKVWIKGGIGFAQLSYNYSDSSGEFDDPIDDGAALMVGAGIELLSSRDFALDLQGRYIRGTYDGIDDSISSGTIGIGVNWY
jgi:hypothetical protein